MAGACGGGGGEDTEPSDQSAVGAAAPEESTAGGDQQEEQQEGQLTAPVDTVPHADERDGGEAPAELEPQFGGILRVAVEAETDGLNPAANEQRRIDDVDRRRDIWYEIQEMMRDAYTHIFFNHANWTIGTREEVHNVCRQTAPAVGTKLFCNNQGRAQLHQVWLG